MQATIWRASFSSSIDMAINANTGMHVLDMLVNIWVHNAGLRLENEKGDSV
jgi:hypothetical protein